MSSTAMRASGIYFDSESHVAAYDQPATSTSYNVNCFESIPYYAEERVCNDTEIVRHNYVYARYLSIKRRGFRLKRIYSTRARGPSGPIQLLARKLGRFKVRTVVAVGTAKDVSDRRR